MRTRELLPGLACVIALICFGRGHILAADPVPAAPDLES